MVESQTGLIRDLLQINSKISDFVLRKFILFPLKIILIILKIIYLKYIEY